MSTRAKESVWDYPRPPAVERDDRLIQVVFGGVRVADTTTALRVLETSHPPTFYLPAADVRTDLLVPANGATVCEWKGVAAYFDLVDGERRAARAVWTYREPKAGYEVLRHHYAFYPGLVDECWVGDERAAPQEGDFYGGWITSEIEGPIKGGPGTGGW
jgi:uncharacterized protein (DUF427 family)